MDWKIIDGGRLPLTHEILCQVCASGKIRNALNKKGFRCNLFQTDLKLKPFCVHWEGVFQTKAIKILYFFFSLCTIFGILF